MAKQETEENRLFLRPLVGLLDNQDDKVVEKIVVDQIRKHRLLRDEAVRIQGVFASAGSISVDAQQQANEAYIGAMIAAYAQQTVVSTLIEILGYIPDVPGEKHH